MEKSYNLPVHPDNQCEAKVKSGRCREQASTRLLVEEGEEVVSMLACYFHTKATMEGLSYPTAGGKSKLRRLIIKQTCRHLSTLLSSFNFNCLLILKTLGNKKPNVFYV